jgi:hypothetical protein
MGKRTVCRDHINYAAIEKQLTLVDSTKCSVCEKKNRPKTLTDLARMMEHTASDMRFAYDHPDYDPHGITWARDFENIVFEYIKAIHVSYAKNFVNAINKQYEIKKNE